IAQGDWRLFFVHRDRLADVTAEDVQAAAEKYLVEPNRTAGLFLPTESANRVTVPAAPNVAETVDGYEGQTEVEDGEAMTSDLRETERRVTRHSLPNGMQVALLPTKARGNAVYAVFRMRYGSEEALAGHTTAAGMIPALLMRGTKQRDFQQLRDDIDALQSTIAFGGGGGRRGSGGSTGVASGSIVSDRDHYVEVIRLLGEILQQPTFAEDEFEIIVNRRRSQMEQAKTDPMMSGMIAMGQAMSPWPEDSIHYVPTMQERLERLNAVTLDEVKDIYAKHYGANQMDVAIVGDFDPDEVLVVLEEVFGDWQASADYQRIAQPHRQNKPGLISINTPDKEMAVVGVGSTFELQDTDERYPALVLAGYVLGQSKKSRLLTQLRHEGGLSYSAFGSVSADSFEPRGSVRGIAICAPQNAPEALETLRAAIKSWIEEGITQEELDDAKQSYVLNMERRNAGEQFLAGQLAQGLELDRTLEFRAQLLDQIQALTLEDVQQALAELMANLEMSELMAGSINEPS
ncbi:MAG: pitrilysin family protein, partial [Planctomycetota bacterium]